MPNEEQQESRGEPKRIQFEFSPDAFERLNRVKELSESSTYADLVRKAVQAYGWLIEQEKAGYKLALVKDDTVQTVKFLY